MNSYAFVGFAIAFGGSAFYAASTLLASRRVAAQVLAMRSGQSASSSSPAADPSAELHQ